MVIKLLMLLFNGIFISGVTPLMYGSGFGRDDLSQVINLSGRTTIVMTANLNKS